MVADGLRRRRGRSRGVEPQPRLGAAPIFEPFTGQRTGTANQSRSPNCAQERFGDASDSVALVALRTAALALGLGVTARAPDGETWRFPKQGRFARRPRALHPVGPGRPCPNATLGDA